MKLTPGKLAGMKAVSDSRGVIAAAAMDQRGSLKKSLAKEKGVPDVPDKMLEDFKTSYKSSKLGDKLKRVYFAPGQEYDYMELTKRFTGKPLTADAALKLLD